MPPSYFAVLLVAVDKVGLVTVALDAAVHNTANGQHQLYWKRRQNQTGDPTTDATRHLLISASRAQHLLMLVGAVCLWASW